MILILNQYLVFPLNYLISMFLDLIILPIFDYSYNFLIFEIIEEFLNESFVFLF